MRYATILATGLLVAGAPAWAAVPGGDAVRVEFVNPDKFTDVGDSRFTSDRSRAAQLTLLSEHIVARATGRLAAGQVLQVSVTDVDRAGSFEPGRVGMGDVRIVKDIYPPRIDLDFKLTAADGSVVKQGKRQLRDNAFLMSANSRRTDALGYEKALIDEWLERELPSR